MGGRIDLRFFDPWGLVLRNCGEDCGVVMESREGCGGGVQHCGGGVQRCGRERLEERSLFREGCSGGVQHCGRKRPEDKREVVVADGSGRNGPRRGGSPSSRCMNLLLCCLRISE